MEDICFAHSHCMFPVNMGGTDYYPKKWQLTWASTLRLWPEPKDGYAIWHLGVFKMDNNTRHVICSIAPNPNSKNPYEAGEWKIKNNLYLYLLECAKVLGFKEDDFYSQIVDIDLRNTWHFSNYPINSIY